MKSGSSVALTLDEINANKYTGLLEDKNIWLYGTGSKRLRFIYDLYGIRNVYTKLKNKWYDHYRGQRCIVVKNVDRAFMDRCGLDIILQLGDRYPYSGKTRTGHVLLSPRDYNLVVTSEEQPEDILDQVDVAAIRKRFCIVHMRGTQEDSNSGLEGHESAKTREEKSEETCN